MNKLGQGLAVGITAICSMILGSVAIAYTKNAECLLVMAAPCVVALLIMIGDGWENE
jgi:hypothetical protein